MFKVVYPLCLLLFIISGSLTKPMIYKRNQDNIFEPIIIPVSSTVIPVSAYKDIYKYDFALNNKQHHAAHNSDGHIKLITAKKRLDKI